MMDLRFNRIEALPWLWLVLPLAAAIALGIVRHVQRRRRLADAALLPAIAPRRTPGRRLARAILPLLAGLALILALLDPRWGMRAEDLRRRGVDLVVIIDVSRSMLVEDARPSRLERAKQAVRDLLDVLGGDRVALVTIAGTPSIACPLTVDHGAVRLALDTIGIHSADRGGSLLGDGIRLAERAFTDDVPDHKAVIVLSDGEDQGSYPVEAAASLASEFGAPVFTVGIGDSVSGGRVPVEVDGRRTWLVHEGEEVVSRMEPEILRSIALETGGAFIPAGTGAVDMASIYERRIEPIATREFERTVTDRRQPRHQWLTGLALVLLLAEMSIAAVERSRP